MKPPTTTPPARQASRLRRLRPLARLLPAAAIAGWIPSPAIAADQGAAPAIVELRLETAVAEEAPPAANPVAAMAAEAAREAARVGAAIRGDAAPEPQAAPAPWAQPQGFVLGLGGANAGAAVQVEGGVIVGGGVGDVQIRVQAMPAAELEVARRQADAAAGAAEAALGDEKPAPRNVREDHPEAFNKLVTHRVESLSQLMIAAARDSVAALVKEHDLSDAAAAGLVETAEETVAGLKQGLTEDFAEFLDQLFNWSMSHNTGEDTEQLLDMLVTGIESGDIEDYLGFYHAPLDLRLGRQQPWIDAVAAALPDQPSLDAWQQQFDDQVAAEAEAIGEYLDEAQQQLRGAMETELQEQLERLFQMVAFEDDTRDTLKESADEMIDAAFEDWRERVTFVLARTEQDFWDSFAEEFGVGVDPVDWEQAIAAILTEEQRQAWALVREERDKEEMQRFEERIEATAANYENHFRNRMNESIDEVLLLMELEDERAERFRKAADDAVREVIEEWKQEARDWVGNLDGDARQQALRRGNVPIGFDGDKVQKQPSWTGAFEQILTEDELQRWNDIREAFDRQRHTAAARVILVSMDQGVGLTASQWEQLAELFDKADLTRIVQRFTANHFHMHPNEFGRALRSMPEDKVREILTDTQWQRWGDYIDFIENPHGTRRSVRAVRDGGGRDDGDFSADARRMEQTVTQFIHQRTAQERDRVLMEILAEIEFVSLTADLPDLTLQRLQTAAKGAAEEVIDEWDDNFTRTIRDRLRTVQNQNFERQLASLGHFNFSSRDVTETRVWNRLLSYLDAEGHADTRALALAQREALHLSAIADIVTIHSAGQLGMAPSQWPDLHAAVLASLAEYGPDFEAAMGRSNVAWYLRNPGIIMPLAGIPEDQLRAILTERQYRRWRDQVGTSTTGFWSRVESSHRQRTSQSSRDE